MGYRNKDDKGDRWLHFLDKYEVSNRSCHKSGEDKKVHIALSMPWETYNANIGYKEA